MRISECASLLNLDQQTRQRLATEKLVVTSLTPDIRTTPSNFLGGVVLIHELTVNRTCHALNGMTLAADCF
jgi:hypothetical protein